MSSSANLHWVFLQARHVLDGLGDPEVGQMFLPAPPGVSFLPSPRQTVRSDWKSQQESAVERSCRDGPEWAL